MLRLRYPKIKTTLDLQTALQNAIMLELGTIPPYLTAWWTLNKTSPGARTARGVLSGIWQDEMFHMLAACNLLNAIGGAPVLNDPAQVPKYPGPLPMTIGSDAGHPFNVSLRRYSKALVQDTFMVIEEPEDPVEIPVGPQALAADIDDHYKTIGEFYIAVEAKIVEEGESLFAHSKNQVTFDPVTPITDVASAQKALQRIRFQGEGVPKTPFTVPGGTTFAHFYRFESLWKGMALKVVDGKPFFDPTKPIVVDEAADVIQMVDNPGQADLSQDPDALQKAKAFDQAYKGLLNDLQDIVSKGDSDALGIAVDVTMPSLTDAAMDLLGHKISAGPQAGQFAGPRFLVT